AIPPRQVVLHFGEPVEIEFGSLRVFTAGGRRVDEGGAHHPPGEGSAVAVGLPAHLPVGTYVVAWRVVSDDSHPVHGGFVFSVGTAAGAGRAESAAAALASSAGSTVVGVVYGVVRFLTFASLLVLVGLGAAVVTLWPASGRLCRTRRTLWASWAGLFVTSVAGVAVQGVYAAALPFGRIVSPALFGEVLRTRFGEVQVLRMALLVAVVPPLVSLCRAPEARRRLADGAGAILAVGLLLTPGLAGHASETGNGVVGETVDALHLAAAAAWIGGIVLIALVLLPGLSREPPAPGAGELARRFSPFAVGAVGVVVTTGLVQSLRQVGSWYALLHTPYGRMLVVKVSLVALLVVLGATARRSLTGPRRSGGPHRGTRVVPAELLAAATVLAVTSLLVNAAPARQAAATPFVRAFDVLGVQVNAVVGPSQVGTGNAFHFYVLGRTGTPEAIAELDASISLPAAGVGPRALALTVAGPGHYQAPDVDIPRAGNWLLLVTVRTAPGAEQQVRATLPVH
ncbi:MAG: CopD family protein, partial [Acidobacteriota bacterium]|nr:CopD family protein [Acidobacteriota bacterium]